MARIAVLSTAHIHTDGFLRNIREAKDGRIIHAIWDDVPARGHKYADKFEAAFTDNLEALLGDHEVDGFLICAENTRHLALLERVMPLGKPVFCEKPLVASAKDLKKLAALVKKHPGTVLFAGYFKPFALDMRHVAELLKRDFFGKITRVRYRNAHHAAYGRWFDNPDLAWFTQPDLSGGGAFMDMGTHAVHLVRSLFGPVEEVFATIGNHAGEYPEVDDHGIALLRFESGVLGTVEAAWTQTGGIGGLEITGSDKTLFNTEGGYVISGPKYKSEPLYLGNVSAAPTQVDRLVAAIRKQIEPEVLAADLAASLDAVAIMDACYQSAAKEGKGSKATKGGKWVKVSAV
jgi:predicted dehydrogenase